MGTWREHPWRLVAYAFAAGSAVALGAPKRALLRGLADIFGEALAAALVQRAQSWIDAKERVSC